MTGLIDLTTLAVFLPAALILNLTPGSDFLYCLGQGIKGGPLCGISASLGIATGSLIHCLLAAFGLSAVFGLYPVAFEILRWSGVCYLLWLAYRSLQETGRLVIPDDGETRQWLHAWRDGVMVNLLNPKVAIFILAFIPQFIVAERGSPILQFLILGLVFNISGTSVNAIVGVSGARLGDWLRRSPGIARQLQIISAIVFVVIAIRLATG